MKLCYKCRREIPAARLVALPYTRHCVECSDVSKVKGYMTWEHKTAPIFNFVSDGELKYLKKHERTTVGAKLPMDTKR